RGDRRGRRGRPYTDSDGIAAGQVHAADRRSRQSGHRQRRARRCTDPFRAGSRRAVGGARPGGVRRVVLPARSATPPCAVNNPPTGLYGAAARQESPPLKTWLASFATRGNQCNHAGRLETRRAAVTRAIIIAVRCPATTG